MYTFYERMVIHMRDTYIGFGETLIYGAIACYAIKRLFDYLSNTNIALINHYEDDNYELTALPIKH